MALETIKVPHFAILRIITTYTYNSMGSNRVGSVFLGDIQRHRHFSSSTHGSASPPSSPPPTGTGQNSIAGVFSFSQAQSHSPTTLAPTTESLSSGSGSEEEEEEEELDSETDSDSRSKNRSAAEDIVGANAEHHQGPGKVDSVLALELRLRWLEALILGMKQDSKGKAREEYAGVINFGSAAAANLKPGETLTRLAESVQSRLRKVVEGNEGLRRFMDNCMFPILGPLLSHSTFSIFVFPSYLAGS